MRQIVLWILDKLIILVALVFFIFCLPFMLILLADSVLIKSVGALLLAIEVFGAAWLLGIPQLLL